MLNEAIGFAKEDGSAYLTLQEAVENKNKVDKQRARKSTYSGGPPNSETTGWVHILDDEQVLRVLDTQALEREPATSRRRTEQLQVLLRDIRPPAGAAPV